MGNFLMLLYQTEVHYQSNHHHHGSRVANEDQYGPFLY